MALQAPLKRRSRAILVAVSVEEKEEGSQKSGSVSLMWSKVFLTDARNFWRTLPLTRRDALHPAVT